MDFDVYLSTIDKYEIPEVTPSYFSKAFYHLNRDVRAEVISRAGFVLVDKMWTSQLAKYIGSGNVLEVMSGCGILSKALMEHGVKVIPTDNFSWGGRNWNALQRYFTDIENIDAIDAIIKYGADVDYILMSWPYMDDTAYRCLLKMREINPNCKMIYIGESWGGCTADDAFFDAIIEWENININIPSWYGIHDELLICK